MEEKKLIEETGTPERKRKYIAGIILGNVAAMIPINIESNVSSDSPLVLLLYLLLIVGPLLSLFSLILLLMSKCEIVVTTHRVYGRGIKEQVDLPLDSISAIKMGWFKSVGIATSSGRIKFYLLTKQNEIFTTVSDLLKERQHKQQTTIIKDETAQSNADELKKYKELLDSGVISQEEFDTKKKQLLGL